ncbi:MAG: hypothetical protein HY820_45875 [Acidobacteria bacterium]|nr:hypothetical protein [Acidobacteriota bacterium]
MTITPRPEHERYIAQAIEAGTYRNADEAVARALEVLRSEDEGLRAEKQAIEEKLERAERQFEGGEFYSAEESRADLARRKAEWLASRG